MTLYFYQIVSKSLNLFSPSSLQEAAVEPAADGEIGLENEEEELEDGAEEEEQVRKAPACCGVLK